nr:hypothetical protein [Haliangium ochraceum]
MRQQMLDRGGVGHVGGDEHARARAAFVQPVGDRTPALGIARGDDHAVSLADQRGRRRSPDTRAASGHDDHARIVVHGLSMPTPGRADHDRASANHDRASASARAHAPACVKPVRAIY